MVDSVIASVLKSHDPSTTRVSPTERCQFGKGFVDALSPGLIWTRHESGVISAEKNDTGVFHFWELRVGSFQVWIPVAGIHPVWDWSAFDQVGNCESSNVETWTSPGIDGAQLESYKI